MRPASPSIYLVSCDGLPMSGIVEEAVKLGHLFHRRGWRVHLDLGYDIKARTAWFGRPDPDPSPLPPWVRLHRVARLREMEGYDAQFLLDLVERGVRLPDDPARDGLRARAAAMAGRLAGWLVDEWRRLDVRFVVVENGTIPENLVWTWALRRAAAAYGRERGLGRYVLWRDHDVMWYYVHGRYGDPPYPNVPRPAPSPHVLHAATNAAAAERLSAWAGVPVEVFPFFHTFGRPRVTERNRGLREALGIDPAALVIARCTRVVPPKRIDRDLHLLAEMKRRMDGGDRPVCLVVTGPTDENAAEHRRLVEMARALGVEDQVRWAGGMLSFEEVLNGGRRSAGARWSVRDLLAHAELSSFLTSHRFEGYGLPPGEAIAAGVPFISSRYELYDAVWGRHGFRTLPFDISPADTELPGRDYAERVLAYLRDPGRRRADAAFNQRLGRPLLSIDAFEDRFAALFPGILADFPRSPRPPRRRTSHLAHDA